MALVSEARKAGGKGFNARDYSSGSMFPDSQSALSSRPYVSCLRKSRAPTAGGALPAVFIALG